MSNCKQIKEKIMEFIDDEVSMSFKKEILKHINECESCKKEYENQLKLKNLIRKNIQKTPPNFSFCMQNDIFVCFETISKLVDFEDGALDQKERKKISAHLLECAYCRQEYDKIKNFNNTIKTSLHKTPFSSFVNARSLVINTICEHKKHTIVASSAIASCVMLASLVSFSSIDNKNLTEVSFRKEEVVQEKPEQIVLKDINEETIEDSQKLIYEFK